MRHRLKWFIHPRAHGHRGGDEHPTYAPNWSMVYFILSLLRLFRVLAVRHQELVVLAYLERLQLAGVVLQRVQQESALRHPELPVTRQVPRSCFSQLGSACKPTRKKTLDKLHNHNSYDTGSE